MRAPDQQAVATRFAHAGSKASGFAVRLLEGNGADPAEQPFDCPRPHEFLSRNGEQTRRFPPIDLRRAMITASLQRPTIFGRVQLRRRSGSDCPGRAGQALRSRGFVPRRRIIRPRLEEQSRHRDDEVSTIDAASISSGL